MNKSKRQQTTTHQQYGQLPPITKTMQVRRTRHAGHCWRSRNELISDVLLWTPTYGRAKAGRPARTYIQQLCEDTGCSAEDLPEAMNDRDKWRERVRDIRAGCTTWWWWYHLWDVRPYASLWVFLFSGPFVEVFSSIFRMFPSILREGQPKCLSLWWDFYHIVWFQEVFSFFWVILFKTFFSFPLIWSNIPKYFKVSFSQSPLSFFFFFFWFGSSISSVICYFLLFIICVV